MAKKKTTSSDTKDEELDVIDNSESKVSENSEEDKVEDSSLIEEEEDETSPPIEEEEIEEEKRKDYKYLKARILEQHNNIYQIEFLGISHGFLNYLSSKLIDEKGVNYSAYKETSLSPPVLTVVTDGTLSIQKILKNTCKEMKSNISSLKKAIATSIN
jgi:DNA-directed RNA polymerase subunit L